MYENPEESAQIIAKVYKLEPDIALAAVKNLTQKGEGLPYWSTGKFDLSGMKEMWRAQILVGAADKELDWSSMLDESFLPPADRILK